VTVADHSDRALHDHVGLVDHGASVAAGGE
jgi:hypothetical protein